MKGFYKLLLLIDRLCHRPAAPIILPCVVFLAMCYVIAQALPIIGTLLAVGP